MVYGNNTGRLGFWFHQCVLRNTLAGSKTVVSTSRNPTVVKIKINGELGINIRMPDIKICTFCTFVKIRHIRLSTCSSTWNSRLWPSNSGWTSIWLSKRKPLPPKPEVVTVEFIMKLKKNPKMKKTEHPDRKLQIDKIVQLEIPILRISLEDLQPNTRWDLQPNTRWEQEVGKSKIENWEITINDCDFALYIRSSESNWDPNCVYIMRMCMHVCMYVCMCVCVCVCMCVCVK